MMVEHLKQDGASHSSSDLLKISGKMDDSWTAQALRQAGETPSGPFAFLIFCFMRTRHTSFSQILSAGCKAGEDVDGCVERQSEQVWRVRPGFSNLQSLILHSAGGWCLVAGDGFQATLMQGC